MNLITLLNTLNKDLKNIIKEYAIGYGLKIPRLVLVIILRNMLEILLFLCQY